MRSSMISVLLLALAASSVACRPVDNSASGRADNQTWARGQSAYQTNNLQDAYEALLKLRRDLLQMQTAGRSNLNYVYCGAVLNGQLFALAQRMGQTNAADGFYQDSARYWAENHKSLRLPPKDFSRAEVLELI